MDVSICKIHDITSILIFIVANLRDLFRLHKLFAEWFVVAFLIH
ncbi:hypothetical protein BACSTE_03085 [Bacteroides stercoris ATCC 43183]|uniref:Uncharacterized protein n=1 Tax=Bacteroides stercoris ATCC 43183 TaxID=449673 RepID=B0NUA0_BACSE|nr:hypothetical protein BACSTE_03085 [Bacteroides stercoris ATCC 43183]